MVRNVYYLSLSRRFHPMYSVIIVLFVFMCISCSGGDGSNMSAKDYEDIYEPVVVYEKVQTVGPSGGKIVVIDANSTINGAEIVIPQDAIIESIDIGIAISRSSSGIVDGVESAGLGVEFYPSGLIFPARSIRPDME